jgi:antitoxin YefM
LLFGIQFLADEESYIFCATVCFFTHTGESLYTVSGLCLKDSAEMYMYRRCQMRAITYTAARQNLAKTMEKVCKDHAPVIVTRKTAESVVIISMEDYEALEETAYLLRSYKNTRRLIESISQLEDGGGKERELSD